LLRSYKIGWDWFPSSVRLPVEKGIFTKDECLDMVKVVDWEMGKKRGT
jgi:hypothetical protein